ncbi:curli assembly protein CsgF [Desulfoferula mesophila]|uniref:Curli production assembly/transport component CsgF n=1 Tax=Desulfoferula mesophila TaxID=3058419 RepID=A0AAU9EGU4_9BACT|nr:hypothetical protein FAK_30710 [Desulfoferula mesophilus]
MTTIKPSLFTLIFAAALLAMATTASATELVWAPINPNFVGGNPLMANALLANAQSQDNNKDPDLDSAQSRLDDFTDNLNRSILSLLSARIVERAFGTDSLPNGTFTIGDYTVVISDTLGSLNVNVSDTGGNNTHISIPTF